MAKALLDVVKQIIAPGDGGLKRAVAKRQVGSPGKRQTRANRVRTPSSPKAGSRDAASSIASGIPSSS